MFKLLFMVGGFFAGKLYAENGGSIKAIASKVHHQLNSKISDMKL